MPNKDNVLLFGKDWDQIQRVLPMGEKGFRLGNGFAFKRRSQDFRSLPRSHEGAGKNAWVSREDSRPEVGGPFEDLAAFGGEGAGAVSSRGEGVLGFAMPENVEVFHAILGLFS